MIEKYTCYKRNTTFYANLRNSSKKMAWTKGFLHNCKMKKEKKKNCREEKYKQNTDF